MREAYAMQAQFYPEDTLLTFQLADQIHRGSMPKTFRRMWHDARATGRIQAMTQILLLQVVQVMFSSGERQDSAPDKPLSVTYSFSN